jgi:hypothetical protein
VGKKTVFCFQFSVFCEKKMKAGEGKIQKSRSYRDLAVWKIAIEFVKEVYRLTEKFPPSEIYGLTSQIRRAAVSTHKLN